MVNQQDLALDAWCGVYTTDDFAGFLGQKVARGSRACNGLWAWGCDWAVFALFS